MAHAITREDPALKAKLEQEIWRQAFEHGYAAWSKGTDRATNDLLLNGPALAWAESWMMTRPDELSLGQKRYIVRSLAHRSDQTASGRDAFDTEQLRKESRVHWMIVGAAAFTVYLVASNLAIDAIDRPGAPPRLAATPPKSAVPYSPGEVATPAPATSNTKSAMQNRIERAINGEPPPHIAAQMAQATTSRATGMEPAVAAGGTIRADVAAVPPGQVSAFNAARSKEVTARAERDRTREQVQRLAQLSLGRAGQGDTRGAVLLAIEAVQQTTGPGSSPGDPAKEATMDAAMIEGTASLFQAIATRVPLLAARESWTEGSAPMFCADGRRVLASINGERLETWDQAAARSVASVEKSSESLRLVAVDRDCQRVLLPAEDYGVAVWSLTTGKSIARMTGHEADIVSFAFSPNGLVALTASIDATARLWNARTGNRIAELRGHDAGLAGASFSADGRLVLTWSPDKTARLWDAADGRALRTFAGHHSAITGAMFSPDGAHILTTSLDGTARLWSIAASQSVMTIKPDRSSIIAAKFSRDGRLVGTLTQDASVHIWNTQSGRQQIEIAGGAGSVQSFDFSPDGHLLVTNSWSGIATLWDSATGRMIGVLNGLDGPATGVTFATSGDTVVAVMRDGSLRRWPALTSLTEAVKHAAKIAGTCLTTQERAQLGLAGAVPAWCRSLVEVNATP